MKNKRKTYILLIIVLTIWGLLIYKFFSFTSEDPSGVSTETELPLKALAVRKRDTFQIDVNYRDPFLGKMYMPEKASASVKRKVKKKEPVEWPAVIYKGIVSDTKDKKKVFMVIIGGRTYMMKEKETEGEITLKRGNRESIEVKYKGETFNILIQQ